MIGQVFAHSKSTGSARLIMLALADVAHDSGEISAYPRSHKILAKKANVHEATVKKAIDALVALGELTVTERGDGRRSSDYRITIEGARSATPAVADDTPRDSETRPQGEPDAPPISPSLSVGAPSLSEDPAAGAAGHLFVVPDVPPDPEQEAKARAHALTVRVFERKTPKPAQKFVAVLAVAKALLAADWPEADVERAMVETPTISTRACEFTRSRWTNGHDPNAGIDTDRGGPTGLVDWRTS